MAVSLTWRDRASCKDLGIDLFFSDNRVDQTYAVGVCQSCPVRQDCFDNADADDFKYSVRAGYYVGEYKGGPKRPPLYSKSITHDRPEYRENKKKSLLASTERKL